MDDFLKIRLAKYEQWLKDGKISFSSKVIPVNESLSAPQWVLPTAQVENIIRDARFIGLTKCVCRSHYGRCDKPLEVCLVLNEVGQRFVQKGNARQISFPEAVEALKKANAAGLVHLSLYQPDHEIMALCSCCSCCCHDLQLMQAYNRKDLVARSEYIAVTDIEKCIHCGTCAERCVFGARTFTDHEMRYNTAVCVGCGLCVTSCPTQATTMQLRGI